MRKLVAVLVVSLAFVACGGGSSMSTTLPSSSAKTAATDVPTTPTPTPIPPTTPSPAPTPVAPPPLGFVDSPARIVFQRSSKTTALDIGELWISDLGGTDVRRLTPEGVSARFVGLMGDPLSGVAYLYYVAAMTDESATIYRRRFPAGDPEEVLTFAPWYADRAYADLSPDGRSIAYSDRFGVQLLDLDTYHIQQLAKGGDKSACEGLSGSIRDCRSYNALAWSPDGSYLAVREYFYEGGHLVVIAPGHEPVEAGNCCGIAWSPDSQQVCSFGEYGGASDLFISAAPGWAKHSIFPPGRAPDADPNVISCSWLDNTTLAMSIGGFVTAAELITVDGLVSPLPELGRTDQACCSVQVFAEPTTRTVYTQYLLNAPYTTNAEPSQPIAIDVDTGELHSVLQPGDWLINVVTP
jgi:hypothetical protein